MPVTQTVFEAILAQPLNFGHILEICGKAQQDANSITINFGKLKTTSNGTDTGLQLILNFIRKQLIFNQLQASNHNSNKEYDVLIKDLILSEFLNEFKFYIMLGETKFHVALNNKPLINLKYNRNLVELEIQKLQIWGELEYLKQLDHHKYFPNIWPPIQIIDDYLDFSSDQPMSFKPGHIIVIKARLEGNNRGRFIIQFRHARDNKRQECHVSVRFDMQKIIRNSKCRQADDKLAFGQEETDGIFPFDDFSKPFKLAVAFCENKFRLAKDGQLLFNFSYRSPNILQYIMGPKLFGTNGVNVRVLGIEHLHLENEDCEDFEKYSV